MKRSGSATRCRNEGTNQPPTKHEDRLHKPDLKVESSQYETVCCGDAKPNQHRPSTCFRQLTNIDQHAQGLCELFEYPQYELCQPPRNKAPTRKQTFEELDHHLGSLSDPRQKNDAENDSAKECESGDTNSIKRN